MHTTPTSQAGRQRWVALVGNPNTGKSTIFNALTGYRQRIGNFPGVTVEKRTGRLLGDHDSSTIDLVDLPGSYSLSASALDETVVLDVLLGRQDSRQTPDAVVVVMDASNLSRNLFFATQVLEVGKPVVFALNMIDVAQRAGVRVDPSELARELGAPVIPVVASKKRGISALRQAIVQSLDETSSTTRVAFPPCIVDELDGFMASAVLSANNSNGSISRAEAFQTLLDPGGFHEKRLLERYGNGLIEELELRRERIAQAGESLVEVEARVRYAWINRVMDRAVDCEETKRSTSDRIDAVLTHRLVGMLVLLVVMMGSFQAVYSWAVPVMDGIEGLFAWLGNTVRWVMPAGALESLLVDGALSGVGAVLVFLPQIFILFLFIAILEDCGYMARAAFLLDRWMGMVGLTGKSFIPLLSSFACAVPAVMATRTIEDRHHRLVTMLIAPLMSCSARLPVYVLLIAAFIPDTRWLGGFVGLQATTLLVLYALGIVVAVLVASVLKRTLLKGCSQSFLMELPTYKWPSPRTVLYRAYDQGREFCITAGTMIFAVSVVIWGLAYYPHSSSIGAAFETRRIEARSQHQQILKQIATEFDRDIQPESLKTYPPLAEVIASVERIEQSLDERVSDSATDPQARLGVVLRRRADEEIKVVLATAGSVGHAAGRVMEAELQWNEQRRALDQDEKGAYLRGSWLGRMGRWIEPCVEPLGWDWRIGMAAIASFPAREVVIATMGTIYNLGQNHDEGSVQLRDALRQARRPDGRPVFDMAVALSIMVFFALCCQCAATLAAIRRETRSWHWPLFTFTYMTVLAYVGAFVTYRIASQFV